jgi:sugar lactone lactonase YvrE
MKPELLVDYGCMLGENPLWHPEEKCLYWTDILAGKLYRYYPATGKHEACYEGEPVGGFTIQADGALLLFKQGGAIVLWREGKIKDVVRELPDEQESRFNDVIADPVGRVLCGTMPTKERLGRLYRLDLDGSIHVLLEGIDISNGMGFSPGQRVMYYTESGAHRIYRFDYDVERGRLENQSVWLQFQEDEGEPDGLTVDAEGYVWSARWNGSAIYRYSPEGEVDLQVKLPAKKVTSLTFGGEELSDVYITTALGEGTKREEGKGAGGLFQVPTHIKGLPEFYSRILM